MLDAVKVFYRRKFSSQLNLRLALDWLVLEGSDNNFKTATEIHKFVDLQEGWNRVEFAEKQSYQKYRFVGPTR